MIANVRLVPLTGVHSTPGAKKRFLGSDDSPRRAFSYPEDDPTHEGDNYAQSISFGGFYRRSTLSPAFAASQDFCNDAHMKQMDEMIAKMTDAAKQKEAITHLDMSKAEMKKGDMAACMKHMNEAHKAMGM